uniref:Uncharacterized protein n=1 Tax=Cucumis melo TaxID=3656 RepID=A0A9I9EB01_CUCME
MACGRLDGDCVQTTAIVRTGTADGVRTMAIVKMRNNGSRGMRTKE